MPGKNLVNNYSSDAENVWEVLFSHFLLDLDKASNDLQSIVYNLHRTSLKIIFQLMHTMFKNHQKCLIWIFEFSPYFCLIKSDLSGNTIYSKCRIWILAFPPKIDLNTNCRQASVLQKFDIFGIINELLSTICEWDFFCDFQTPCSPRSLTPK